MRGADLIVFESAPNGTWTLTDMHATGNARPVADASQDARLVSASRSGGVTTVVFTRPLAPCDAADDLPIRAGVAQPLIWALGSTPRLGYHGPDARGARSAVLAPLPACPAAKGTYAAPPPTCSLFPAGVAPERAAAEPGSKTLDAVMRPRFVVPPKETTYTCQVVRLPSETKFHIIAAEGLAGPKLHHMVFYRCPAAGPVDATRAQLSGAEWDCTELGPPCNEPVLVWTPGMGAMVLPPNAGFPFGKGESSYFLLNNHYDNPQLDRNVSDASGFRIQYTSKLRPFDLGVLTLGTRDINLPPGQPNISTPPNTCGSTCTTPRIPPAGITVYQTFLHMHLAGLGMVTQHFRGGRELAPLASIRAFDFNFNFNQPPQTSTRQIQPGDTLVTTCTYNTIGRTNVTTKGFGSRDEMCFAFVTYYPRIAELDFCMTAQRIGVVCGKESDARDLFRPRQGGAPAGLMQTVATARSTGLLVPLAPAAEVANATPYTAQCTATTAAQKAPAAAPAGSG